MRILKFKIEEILKNLEQSRIESQIKNQISELSKHIKVNFPKNEVIHSHQIRNRMKEFGHIIDIRERVEYMGEFNKFVFHGNGKKWVKGKYSVEGYFLNGMICGFGEKKYIDKSLYR
jgi:hypothetical protein